LLDFALNLLYYYERNSDLEEWSWHLHLESCHKSGLCTSKGYHHYFKRIFFIMSLGMDVYVCV